MSEYDLTPDEIRENFSTAMNHLTMIKERLIDDLAEKDREIARLKQRLEKQKIYIKYLMKRATEWDDANCNTCPLAIMPECDKICQSKGVLISALSSSLRKENKPRAGIKKLAKAFINIPRDNCNKCPDGIEQFCANNGKCIEMLEAWALNGENDD